MMFALLLGALSLGACVDDSETQSVTDVRNAKAEQLKAAADLATAQADAAKTQAEAQKALAEAQAEFQKAQADAAKIAAEAEAALKEAEAAVKRAEAEKVAAEAAVKQAEAERIAAQTEADRALAETNLQKAQAEAEMAKAAAEKAKAEAEVAKARAEANKKQAELDAAKYMADMETLKLETEAKIAQLEAQIAASKDAIQNSKDEQIQELFTKYTTAVSKLNEFKRGLIQAQYDLAKLESGYATAEESNQKQIAKEEEKIAGFQNEIEALKEYKGYDKTQLWEQAMQLDEQYKLAKAEFETDPVCAALIATNEPLQKAFDETQKQAELVDAVISSNILNVSIERVNVALYDAITYDGTYANKYITGRFYKELSVDEAGKMAYENQLAHAIEYYAEELGTPEDRYDMPLQTETAYSRLARAKKSYDAEVANLEKVKGQFSKVLEAFDKAETEYFAAKDENEKAQADATKDWEAYYKANEEANKAQTESDKAAQKAAEAADKVTETSAALAAAEALPESDPTKPQKVADAKKAYDEAKTKSDEAKAEAAAKKKAADDAKKAADDAFKTANTTQETANKAQNKFTKAESDYRKAQENKGDADQAVKNAETHVVNAQNNVTWYTNRLNEAQANYDGAVKAQKDLAEAFAALDIEAVNAAAAAWDKAIKARIEADDAWREAKKPIEQIYDNMQVALDLWINSSAIDVSAEISRLEEQIAESQEKIDELKAIMNDEVENEAKAAVIKQLEAEIAELEQRIETQTGLVEKAKAALDAALAE